MVHGGMPSVSCTFRRTPYLPTGLPMNPKTCQAGISQVITSAASDRDSHVKFSAVNDHLSADDVNDHILHTHIYIYTVTIYIYIQIFIYGHGLSTRGWHQFPSCGFPRFLRAASHYVGGVDLDIGILKYLRRLGWTCHWDCFWTARVISWKKNHCFPAAKVTRFAERFRVSSLPQSLGGYAWKILPSFFHLVMQQKSGFLSQSGGVTTPHSLPLGRKSHVFFSFAINGQPVP